MDVLTVGLISYLFLDRNQQLGGGGNDQDSTTDLHNSFSNAILANMFNQFINKKTFLKTNTLSEWSRVLLWRMVRFTELPYSLEIDRTFYRQYSNVDKLAKDSVSDILWYSGSILGAHMGTWGAKMFVYDHKGKQNVCVGM